MIDDTKLNSDDELFLKELETVFIRFVDSGKEQFNLEPMNSYKRRLAHKLASQFELETESIGEDKERAVLLKKTPQTKIPTSRKVKLPRIDTGHETYYAKPGVEIVLRSDGSFGIPWKEKDGHLIDKRVIHDGVFGSGVTRLCVRMTATGSFVGLSNNVSFAFPKIRFRKK